MISIVLEGVGVTFFVGIKLWLSVVAGGCRLGKGWKRLRLVVK